MEDWVDDRGLNRWQNRRPAPEPDARSAETRRWCFPPPKTMHLPLSLYLPSAIR